MLLGMYRASKQHYINSVYHNPPKIILYLLLSVGLGVLALMLVDSIFPERGFMTSTGVLTLIVIMTLFYLDVLITMNVKLLAQFIMIRRILQRDYDISLIELLQKINKERNE